MIVHYKKILLSLIILMNAKIIQNSDIKTDATILSSTPKIRSDDFLKIWQASKSSTAYQKEQMRRIQEKMEQEKAETSPK